MDELEHGAIANPDEKRMVGDVWLRPPKLVPSKRIRPRLTRRWRIKPFAADVHHDYVPRPQNRVGPPSLPPSALAAGSGPMLVHDALGNGAGDKMNFLSLRQHRPRRHGSRANRIPWFARRNAVLVFQNRRHAGNAQWDVGRADAYSKRAWTLLRHAVAITVPGSRWTRRGRKEGWLAGFPMFDWIGGRTSVLSAVGLLPAALQGLDIDGLLAGAAACDQATRRHELHSNPAALMALMWYHATGGKGQKDMVVLPYKDLLLLLFSRYLQQLVMESIGKQLTCKDGTSIRAWPCTATKDPPTSMRMCSKYEASNFFAVFIRVLEAGGSAPRSGTGRHGRRLPARLPAGHPAALFENSASP